MPQAPRPACKPPQEVLTKADRGPRVEQGGPFAVLPIVVIFQFTNSLGS